MIHHIQNDHIKVSVRDKGAEITSYFDKTNQIEHIWQADPAFWPWHAPVLFPVVGRCLHDQLFIDGQTYHMEKHGFARRSTFELIAHQQDMLSFLLRSSHDTFTNYPFHFDLVVHYMLSGHSLTQRFEILNRGDNTMYFQLGGHPAFATPFLPAEDYSDYYIEFEKDTNLEREHIDDDGFFDHRRSVVLAGSNRLPLYPAMFSDDALIFKKLLSRRVTLASHKNPHRLSVSFSDFRYLGLWAKVNAPYVCIEPWLGCADTVGEPQEFKDREGVVELGSGREFQASIIMGIS